MVVETDQGQPDQGHAVVSDRGTKRRTFAAVSLGHVLEWYDWGIYAAFVAFFAAQFFDPADEVSAILSSLAVFAVGFLARPLGGLIFGRLSDRKGRRTTIVVTISLTSLGSLAVGVAPTYAAIGAWASLWLVTARVLQGMAAGGEQPSAQTYIAEAAPSGRRGLWSSAIYIAGTLGNSLAVAFALTLSLLLTDDQMRAWGWRVPFIVGGVLGVVVLYLRTRTAETAVFVAHARTERPRLWPEMVRHRKQALQVIGATTGFAVVYYAWVVATPSYAAAVLKVPQTQALLAGLCASIVFMALMPLWGALSDRVGRKPVLLFGGLTTAALLFPLQQLANGSAWRLFLAMSIALVFLGAAVSVLPASFAELFPTSVRTIGLAVPYAIAAALFGGTAPYVRVWFATAGLAWGFSAYVVALVLISVVTIWTLPETRGKQLD